MLGDGAAGACGWARGFGGSGWVNVGGAGGGRGGGWAGVYMLGYGAAWACWWPRVFGVPVWINVDGLEWARSKWGRVARIYLRCMEWVASRVATRLIADAEAIAQRFRETYPKGAPSSFIAYGAELVQDRDVDPSVLSALGLKPRRYMLVVHQFG